MSGATSTDSYTLADLETWPVTVPVPRSCAAIGISSSWGYQLLAQGEFPVRTIQIRGRTRVLTSSLISLVTTGEA